MKISLRNLSTDADLPSYLPGIADALTEQLTEHFGPSWEQMFEDVTIIGKDDKPNHAVITLYDNAGQAGELGDHELDDGLPVGRIFVETILSDGGTIASGSNSVSAVCSHEACEMGADPYANFWGEYLGEDLVALEACDPVEDESYEASNGVALSNFVTPRWFRQGAGPFDWLKSRKAAFEVSPGGYVILFQGGPVFGPQARAEKRAHKSPRRYELASMTIGKSDAPKEILPPPPAHDPAYKMIFVGGKYRRVKA